MVELTFHPPCAPWSINMERTKHWSWRSKRVSWWRTTALVAARKAGVGELPPSRIEVELPFDRGGRRDPSNYLPAVKALIDGLVDAGCWDDDTAEYVEVVEPRLVRGTDVVVRITPR
jgi:Holliday junction resolvase RusA-like endonuclease